MPESASLPVPHFAQHTDYTCGPASLEMVFAFFGVRLSQEHLKNEAHTSKSIGTRHKAMIEAARHHGFFVYANNNSSLAELEYLLLLKRPVIVHFIEHELGWGHYAPVQKIDTEQVHLSDPWYGKNFAYARKDFEHRWKSEDGKHPQWLMSIGLEPFVAGKEYRPRVSAAA